MRPPVMPRVPTLVTAARQTPGTARRRLATAQPIHPQQPRVPTARARARQRRTAVRRTTPRSEARTERSLQISINLPPAAKPALERPTDIRTPAVMDKQPVPARAMAPAGIPIRALPALDTVQQRRPQA